MQITHRISVGSTAQVRRELAAMGWLVGTGDATTGNVVTFEVDESHSNWGALSAWIARNGAGDFIVTTFSKSEIGAAAWLELQPDWHWSYPQPEDGYEAETYDLSEYCEHCGLGLKQRAPFRMRGEPKWGRRGILQLNWIFDEYFVTPDVWASIFRPLGVSSMQVTDAKGRELKTVVQLGINERVGIATEGLDSEVCPKCRRTKYLPVTRGPFPALVGEPSIPVIKTSTYFGSGASAHAAVLVSQGAARALAAGNIRGASVRPVEAAT